MNAVDTNVLVYAHDMDEPAKRLQANSLLDKLTLEPAETVLLYQVAAEFLSCLRRWQAVKRISSRDVELNFRDVMAMFSVRLPSPGVFEKSFDLRSRFSLSHWDSLLLAACQEAGVDTLYSEDMDAGTDFDGVKIINPFA